MRFRFLIFLFSIPVLLNASNLKEEAERMIKRHFKDGAALVFERYVIPPDIKRKAELQGRQRFARDFIYFWNIQVKDTTVGYAVLDNVHAKSASIVLLVIFNARLEVDQVMILKYIGKHGRSVLNKEWLQQFSGKTSQDDLTPGSGIDLVSGATFSTIAVSRSVKKLCVFMQELHNRK